MKEYYNYLVLITIMMTICMLINVSTNRHISYKKQRCFISIYSMLLIATICDYIGTITEGLIVSTNLILAVKFVEFTITPAIPIIYGVVFDYDENKKKKVKYVKISLFIVYVVIEILSLHYKWIFSVDCNGCYSIGNYYFIYIFAFVVSTIYFFYRVWKFCRYYQNRERSFLIAIVVFCTIGISIQFMFTEIKIAWQTVVISSIMMHIFYNNVIIYNDSLTALLNKRSFLTKTETSSEPTMVVLFDVDDFKHINDTYGHNFGDVVLKDVGRLIKETYQQYGLCYRTGGDEFSVLLHDYSCLQALNESFVNKIIEERNAKQKDDKDFPFVSIGYELYDPQSGESILDVIERADKKMFKNKRGKKEKT